MKATHLDNGSSRNDLTKVEAKARASWPIALRTGESCINSSGQYLKPWSPTAWTWSISEIRAKELYETALSGFL